MKEITKKFSKIACCGIDCGLCPRYHTKSASQCPGCGGPNFHEKHPSCGILTCCVSKKKMETCANCEEFPCKRLEKWDEKDSFVTHLVSLNNLKVIKNNGIEEFFALQSKRINICETLMREYNDGRSASFFCLASSIIPIESLENAIQQSEKEILKQNIQETDLKTKSKVIKKYLESESSIRGIRLKLRK